MTSCITTFPSASALLKPWSASSLFLKRRMPELPPYRTRSGTVGPDSLTGGLQLVCYSTQYMLGTDDEHACARDSRGPGSRIIL